MKNLARSGPETDCLAQNWPKYCSIKSITYAETEAAKEPEPT
jgi:hypothetical protein